MFKIGITTVCIRYPLLYCHYFHSQFFLPQITLIVHFPYHPKYFSPDCALNCLCWVFCWSVFAEYIHVCQKVHGKLQRGASQTGFLTTVNVLHQSRVINPSCPIKGDWVVGASWKLCLNVFLPVNEWHQAQVWRWESAANGLYDVTVVEIYSHMRCILFDHSVSNAFHSLLLNIL